MNGAQAYAYRLVCTTLIHADQAFVIMNIED